MRQQLQKISSNELRLLLIGIGVVVTAAMIVVIIVPKAKAALAAQQEVETLRITIEESVELERRLKEQHSHIEDLRYRLHGDMANLPVRQAEAFIIGRLQEVSWTNGVELIGVVPATGERVQIFQEILFNVELTGQYMNLYHWLWDVRNELGYVVIKEYQLNREDDDDGEPLLRAKLSLASYRSVE